MSLGEGNSYFLLPNIQQSLHLKQIYELRVCNILDDQKLDTY